MYTNIFYSHFSLVLLVGIQTRSYQVNIYVKASKMQNPTVQMLYTQKKKKEKRVHLKQLKYVYLHIKLKGNFHKHLKIVRHYKVLRTLPSITFFQGTSDFVIQHIKLVLRSSFNFIKLTDCKTFLDPRRLILSRETSFGRRHLKLWSNHNLLLWLVS